MCWFHGSCNESLSSFTILREDVGLVNISYRWWNLSVDSVKSECNEIGHSVNSNMKSFLWDNQTLVNVSETLKFRVLVNKNRILYPTFLNIHWPDWKEKVLKFILFDRKSKKSISNMWWKITFEPNLNSYKLLNKV